MKIKFTEQVRIANILLNVMKDCVPSGKAIQTISLIKKAGLNPAPDGDRNNCRTILKKLADAGIVGKQGVGSFYWSLKVSQWDVANPFRKTTSPTSSTPPTTSASGSLLITGQTYPVREQLKSLGCKWDGIAKAWKAPNETIRSQGQALVDGINIDESVVESPKVDTSKLDAMILSLKKELADKEEITKQLRTANQILQSEVESKGSHHKKITISDSKGVVATLTDKVLPTTYKDVLDLASVRENILLVGPAGCGKTYLGQLVAESLGLRFESISCTSGISENHLLGKSTPNLTTGKNEFHTTVFLECYEKGGVFLLDEIDAADPNLLLALNSALANGYCNVPNRTNKPKAIMHQDFVCIATANTFGRGATRSYSGRNQLDEASLDRFRIGTIECDYDKGVEFVLCPNDALRHRLQEIRAKVEAAGMRRIISTRFLEKAHKMLTKCNWSIDKIVEKLTSGWTKDEISKIQ